MADEPAAEMRLNRQEVAHAFFGDMVRAVEAELVTIMYEHELVINDRNRYQIARNCVHAVLEKLRGEE